MNFKKTITYFCFCVTFVVYVGAFLGSIRISNGDMFGFIVLVFYIIMPFVSFICALVLQLFEAPKKWFYPFLFSLLWVMMLPLSRKNFVLSSDIKCLCIIPPFLGALIGRIIALLK